MQKRKGFTPQAKGMMVLAKEICQGIDIIGNHFRARFHTCCNLCSSMLQLNHLLRSRSSCRDFPTVTPRKTPVPRAFKHRKIIKAKTNQTNSGALLSE